MILGFDEKGNYVYIEPIAEWKDKKRSTKTDKKVAHVEREEKRDL